MELELPHLDGVQVDMVELRTLLVHWLLIVHILARLICNSGRDEYQRRGCDTFNKRGTERREQMIVRGESKWSGVGAKERKR